MMKPLLAVRTYACTETGLRVNASPAPAWYSMDGYLCGGVACNGEVHLRSLQVVDPASITYPRPADSVDYSLFRGEPAELSHAELAVHERERTLIVRALTDAALLSCARLESGPADGVSSLLDVEAGWDTMWLRDEAATEAFRRGLVDEAELNRLAGVR
jgi:hypothetical protein